MTHDQEDMQVLLQKFTPPPVAPQSYFISFEGIEGAGKSTQILKFQEFLTQLNYRVFILREPGGTAFGEKLREAILTRSSLTPLHPLAEAYLFASSRVQLLVEKILPELNHPRTIILLDRYIDSSLVYQGHSRHLGLKTILNIHDQRPLCYLPHLTFYLKISLETSLSRMQSRGSVKDYFESSHQDFFRSLIEGHDKVHQLFPERIKEIDANQDSSEVFDQIIKVWQNLSK